MTKRRNLERERLEVYLLYILLANRQLFRICGLLILLYSIVALLILPESGKVTLGLAILLNIPFYSYQGTVYLAKIGAWVGTFGKKNS